MRAELPGRGRQVGVTLSIWYTVSREAEDSLKVTRKDAGRVVTPHRIPNTKTACVCARFPGPLVRADGHARPSSRAVHPRVYEHNCSVDGVAAGMGGGGHGLPSAWGGPGAGGTIKFQDLLLRMDPTKVIIMGGSKDLAPRMLPQGQGG